MTYRVARYPIVSGDNHRRCWGCYGHDDPQVCVRLPTCVTSSGKIFVEVNRESESNIQCQKPVQRMV